MSKKQDTIDVLRSQIKREQTISMGEADWEKLGRLAYVETLVKDFDMDEDDLTTVVAEVAKHVGKEVVVKALGEDWEHEVVSTVEEEIGDDGGEEEVGVAVQESVAAEQPDFVEEVMERVVPGSLEVQGEEDVEESASMVVEEHPAESDGKKTPVEAGNNAEDEPGKDEDAVSPPPSSTPPGSFVQAIDPELQRKQGELTSEYNKLERSEPWERAGIEDHLKALKQIREQYVEFDFDEDTRKELTDRHIVLTTIEKDWIETEELAEQAKRATAQKRLNLLALNRCKRDIKELQRKVVEQRKKGYYNDLFANLYSEVATAKEKIGEWRNEVAAILGEWVTVSELEKIQDLVNLLAKMYEWYKNGIRVVPSGMGIDSGTKDLAEAIQEVEDKLIKIYIQQADRRIEEAKEEEKVKPPKLGQAKSEYGKAEKDLSEAKYVADKKPIKDKLVDLDVCLRDIDEKIEQRKKRIAEAENFVRVARTTEDRIEALRLFLEAEKIHPDDRALEDHREFFTGDVRNLLRRQVIDAANKTRTFADKRQYEAARRPITEVLTLLDRLPDDIELDFGSLNIDRDASAKLKSISSVGELRSKLETLINETEQESRLFSVFEPKLNRLMGGATKLKEDELDPEWLLEQKQALGEASVQRFEQEWVDALDVLTAKAGDRHAYRSAQKLFAKQPTDVNVDGCLEKIGEESAYYKDAQDLLKRHSVYLRLHEAENLLEERKLIDDAPKWHKEILDKIQAIEALMSGDHSWEKTPREKKDRIKKSAKFLADLSEEIDALHQNDLQACAKTFSANDHPYLAAKARFVAQPQDDLFRVRKGLQRLRADFEQKWRENRFEFFNSKVFQSKDDCMLRTGVGLDVLRIAACYAEELDEHSLLFMEGDNARIDCIHESLLEMEIVVLLSSIVRQVDVTEFDSPGGSDIEVMLGNLVTNAQQASGTAKLAAIQGIDWEELQAFLEALSKRGGGSWEKQQTTRQAQAVIQGAYVFHLPREDAITYLENKRESHPSHYENPALCAMLVLRYLEADAGKSKSQGLVAELEAGSRSDKHLAGGLRRLVQAHTNMGEGTLDSAIQEMEAGIAILEKLQIDIGLSLNAFVVDIQSRWTRETGETILADVSRRAGNVRGLDVFAVLRETLQAELLLGSDNWRVQEVLNNLKPKVKDAEDKLVREIERLLEDKDAKLKKRIVEGQKYKIYLDIALGFDYQCGEIVAGPCVSPPADLNILCNALQDLCAHLDLWRKGNDVLDDIHRKRQELLQGEWQWSTVPLMLPNSGLKDMKRLLSEAEEHFDSEIPVEITHLRQWIGAFQDAATTIGTHFEEFRRNFEGDKYRNAEEYQRAKKNLRSIQSYIIAEQTRLREMQRKFGWDDDYPLNLSSFFWVRDQTPPLMSGGNHANVSSAEKLTSISAVEYRLDDREKSLDDWKKWVEEINTTIEKLSEQTTKANNYIRGDLGQAIKLAEKEIHPLINQLEALKESVPPPPLSQLALIESQDIEEPDEGLFEDVLDEFVKNLQDAQRSEIQSVWETCLKEILTAAKEGLSDLNEQITSKQKELSDIIARMAKIRSSRRPAKHRIERFEEDLQKAQRIDRNHPHVQSLGRILQTFR